MSGKHGQISLQEGGEGRGGPHYRGRATLDILMTIHKTARADRLVYQSLFPRRVICVIRAGVVEVTGAVGGGRLEAGGQGQGSYLLPQEKHTPAEPDCETGHRTCRGYTFIVLDVRSIRSVCRSVHRSPPHTAAPPSLTAVASDPF